MDYLLVLRPTELLPPEKRPRVAGSARAQWFCDPAEAMRVELSFPAFETAGRFGEDVRGWLEAAERAGMTAFDPQIGRVVTRADLAEILDCRGRALAYALGVLGDAGVGPSEAPRPARVPALVWAAAAIAAALVVLRVCSSFAG